MKQWYSIDSIKEIDSPSLFVFIDRVKENIRTAEKILPDLSRLRPHVKTSKSAEVVALLREKGVTKFKCATISEAEMLASAGSPDVLLAYQPVGPKVLRLLELVKKFRSTTFSCLVDNAVSARTIADAFNSAGESINVFIDINVGMNRTGISPEAATVLFYNCIKMSGIKITGLHAYDGHIRDSDPGIRSSRCLESHAPVESVRKWITSQHGDPLVVVAGGTPTFPIHAKRKDVECSPGTFVYWDRGYQQQLADEPFIPAALVATRVISKPTSDTLCVDLGHKAIASENPIDKRVFFLNAPDARAVGHSEEHMVLQAPGNSFEVGNVLYGLPYHICPTVALYDRPLIVEGSKVVGSWETVSRNRSITI